jgi:type II secretory pathway pseudopilin PulG
MSKPRESEQLGFSLIEFGIVLALVGAGLFFVFTKMRETSEARYAQTASRDLTQIITNFQRLYSSQGRFPPLGTVSNLTLAQNNVFPSSWVDSTNAVRSPVGTAFRIDIPQSSGPFASIPERTFAAIVIDNVPTKICTELAQLMLGGALGVRANFMYIKHPATGAIDLTVMRACSDGPNVEMVFFFGRNT